MNYNGVEPLGDGGGGAVEPELSLAHVVANVLASQPAITLRGERVTPTRVSPLHRRVFFHADIQKAADKYFRK